MSIKFKFIICWLWSNKEQIFEDILLYADTLDLLNLCFVLFCEMLRFLFDQNSSHKKSLDGS